MERYVIQTTNLTKCFGKRVALRDLSLELEHGRVHAVVGSNGAGKSTLFRILLGVLPPSNGEARLLGHDCTRIPPAVRGRVGLVNEDHTLPGWVSVQRLVEMQRAQYSGWNESAHCEVLDHFDVDPSQRISQLSRGERAGLNLALALAQSPELLILDEPTLGLDVVAKQAFIESLLFAGSLLEQTIVYCSHQMDEIERVADSLVLLRRGELLEHTPPDALLERTGYWIARGEVSTPTTGLPGLLQERVVEGQHHFIVLDQGPDFGSLLATRGFLAVTRLQPSLDRAVNAYLSRDHA